MLENGIKHIRVSPYHPSSNGKIERFVRTFKQAMIKTQNKGDLHRRVASFLLGYRTSPYATTGVSPCELIFGGRKVRTRLDLVHPSVVRTAARNLARQQQNHDATGTLDTQYHTNQPVWVRWYTGNARWKPGVIVRILGPVNYDVAVGEQCSQRHAEQLRPRFIESPTPTIATRSTSGAEIEDLYAPDAQNLDQAPFRTPPETRTSSPVSPPVIPEAPAQSHSHPEPDTRPKLPIHSPTNIAAPDQSPAPPSSQTRPARTRKPIITFEQEYNKYY
jgi:hypothetical protein